MSFQILHCPHHSLPRFAWAAEIRVEQKQVRLYHGDGVEKSPDGRALVEGAWAGNFPEFDFHLSTALSGTGMREAGGELHFCSSTDRAAPLFSVIKSGRIYFSNSIIYVLSLSETRYIPNYPYYHHDILAMIRKGLYCLDGKTPLMDGHQLHVHFSCISSVRPSGEIRHRPFPEGEIPSSFESYRNILHTTVEKVFENGLDPARAQPLKSIATISTGYDSSATAAIAAAAGCTEAVTFFDSKSATPHADNGKNNAAALGMSCLEFDRWKFMESPHAVEPEFCFMAGTCSAPFAAMEHELADRIMVCGHYGGDVWTTAHLALMDQLSTPWSRSCAGTSHGEFRLRVGYISMDPSVIASRHHVKLAEIFAADDMHAWSVDGKYNRPAARRLAEEAGIPKGQLGVKKYMTSHTGLKKKTLFSEAGHARYCAFFTKSVGASRRPAWIYWRIHFAVTYFLYYKLTSSRSKILKPTPLRRRFPYLLNAAPLRITWKYLFTFQWAFDELKHRYQSPSTQEDRVD